MMRCAPFVVFAFFALIYAPLLSHAEGMPKDAYISVLLELNRVKPQQNPAYAMGERIIGARILDKNNRTIAKVEDIILSPEGKFETILTHIDATGFREPAAFDVASYVTEPTSASFTISMDKEQLKQNAAQLLADMPMASGENGPFSLNSIQKAEIVKVDGSKIAQVENALIDIKSSQIAALLVVITDGERRGRRIAIPYEAATAKLVGSKAVLSVTDEQAEVIASMATGR